MAKKVEVNEAELKAKLDPLSYEVLRNGATERPFTGEYTDSENVGIYRCKACNAEGVNDRRNELHRQMQLLQHRPALRRNAPAPSRRC